MTERSLNEVKLARFLDHKWLPGPTRTLPGPGITGAKGGLATPQRSPPFHVQL